MCTRRCTLAVAVALALTASTGHAGAIGAGAAKMAEAMNVPAMAAKRFHMPDGPFVPWTAGTANPKVYGKTYGEWAAEWWKWALSLPEGMNPVQDDTGEFCTLGQAGPVWFLAGSFGVTGVERKCTIPAGKAIFYPLVNAFWIDEPGDEVFTDEEVRTLLVTTAGGDGACQLTSTLDTFDTRNLGELPAPVTAHLQPVVRAQSPRITIELPEDNILGFPPGPNERLIAEGYWVMLPPLTPGKHRLNLHGAACAETEEGMLEKTFETDVTYHLRVLRKRHCCRNK